MGERHPFDVLDDHRGALSALATSARFAAALPDVPEAEIDALLAVSRWADARLIRVLAQQAALLPAGTGVTA